MSIASDNVPRPQRALVIDDDAMARTIVRRTLESHGFEVVEAADGASGLKLALQMPDVIVCDLLMPDISGLAVCRAVRTNASTADIPCVFLTASNDESTVVSCFQAGGTDYVAKPFSPAVLAIRVEAAVKVSQAERTRRKYVDELTRAYSQTRDARADDALRQRLIGLGCIANGIAHEMNSPLSVLLCSLGFVKERASEVQDPAFRRDVDEAIADATASANRISALIRRMRAIAGLEVRTRADVDVYERALQVGRIISQATRVDLKVSGSPVVIDVVEAEVREALTALIENAAQAASASTPEPRVEVQVGVEDDSAVIVVDDNGPGIDEADLPFLFDPFFSKKRVWQTPGLGLTIAHAAARRHGGSIEIEPRGPLGGARARLKLPLRPVDASSEHELAAAAILDDLRHFAGT